MRNNTSQNNITNQIVSFQNPASRENVTQDDVSNSFVAVIPPEMRENPVSGAASINILGTASQITVANDGAGTFTIAIVIPLGVPQGGSGATSFTDGGILLGSGTGAFTALAQATNGQIPIGSTGADPVLANITALNGIDITSGAGTIQVDADLKANGGLVFEGNEIAVDLAASSITGILAPVDAGTGISAPTDHSLIVGSGNAAMTELGVATDGQLPIGSTGADPSLATLTGTTDEIEVTNAAASITLSLADAAKISNISCYENEVMCYENEVLTYA